MIFLIWPHSLSLCGCCLMSFLWYLTLPAWLSQHCVPSLSDPHPFLMRPLCLSLNWTEGQDNHRPIRDHAGRVLPSRRERERSEKLDCKGSEQAASQRHATSCTFPACNVCVCICTSVFVASQFSVCLSASQSAVTFWNGTVCLSLASSLPSGASLLAFLRFCFGQHSRSISRWAQLAATYRSFS